MTKNYKLIQGSVICFVLTMHFAYAQFANGLIISNEGNFGTPNADVSYLDQTTFQIINNVYQTVNNEPLGDVLNDVGFYGDRGYLVLNNSNKIVVVNRSTFEKIDVITENISMPRTIGFSNDKIYITNSTSNKVSVYNIADNSYVTQIQTSGTIEDIVNIGQYVFIQNGYFSSGNKIIVIDSTTDSIIGNIIIEDGINGLVVNDEFLYAISSGSNYTHLYKINPETHEIINDFRTTSVSNGAKLQISDDYLYFVGNGNSVYKISENLNFDLDTVFSISNPSWFALYGFGVTQDFIFSANANGFTSASIIEVYNKNNGTFIAEFSAGIGANGFYENITEDLSISHWISDKMDVQLYPNPTKDYFKIDCACDAKIQIYNSSSKLVKRIDYQGQEVYVGDLPKGIYIVNIQTKNLKVNKKLLIQ